MCVFPEQFLSSGRNRQGTTCTLLLGETGDTGSEREGDKKRRRWEKSGEIIDRFEGDCSKQV